MNSDWMMADEVFSWLEQNIVDGATILEFGSGHGSIKLAERYNLFSVEHDNEWVGISDSTYIFAEIKENSISTEHEQKGWYDPSPIQDVVKKNIIDVFIIDGPPGTIGRHGLLSLLDILPKSAIFIVDDVHRDPELDLFNKLAEWHGGKDIIYSSRYDSGKERKWAVLLP